MDTCSICNENKSAEGFAFDRYAVYICKNCGFRWLHPRPTATELSMIYSDQYFLDEGDAEIKQIVNSLKRATACLYLDQLIEQLSSPKELSLLEVGCGMGDFLLEAQAKGFRVFGLEVTDYLVGFANRRLGIPSVQKGLIEGANFQKESFDVVVFFDVIEHIYDPMAFMRRVNRLLKKNGKVHLVTPSLDSWSAKLLGKHWMEYKVEHLSYFNKMAIRLLLEKTNFHKIKFYPNYKVLSFDYINRHFVRFPVRGLSPLISFIRKHAPHRLAHMPIKVIASGMAVIAEKRV